MLVTASVNFLSLLKQFYLQKNDPAVGSVSRQLWHFPNIFYFPKIFSPTLFGNLRSSSYEMFLC